MRTQTFISHRLTSRDGYLHQKSSEMISIHSAHTHWQRETLFDELSSVECEIRGWRLPSSARTSCRCEEIKAKDFDCLANARGCGIEEIPAAGHITGDIEVFAQTLCTLPNEASNSRCPQAMHPQNTMKDFVFTACALVWFLFPVDYSIREHRITDQSRVHLLGDYAIACGWLWTHSTSYNPHGGGGWLQLVTDQMQ